LRSVIPGRKIGTGRIEAYCSTAPGSASIQERRALHRAAPTVRRGDLRGRCLICCATRSSRWVPFGTRLGLSW